MIYPHPDKIDKEIDSKYALVVLAAKRAKQVKEGARPLIQTDSTNPLTIALEEIANGSLKYQFNADSLAGREALADKEAVKGDRDLEVAHDPLAMPDDLLTLAAIELGAEPGDLNADADEEAEDEDELEEEPLELTDEDSDEGEE